MKPMNDQTIENPAATEWTRCADKLPPRGKVVRVKIDDRNGCRNECQLKRLDRLWFTPDGAMYVYWTPTHWRNL